MSQKKNPPNKVKQLLDKLNITPTDEWMTLHIFYGKKDPCYYYAFKHKGIEYCVSGDSLSYCFSSEKNEYDMLYMGYSIKDLQKAIEKVVKC